MAETLLELRTCRGCERELELAAFPHQHKCGRTYYGHLCRACSAAEQLARADACRGPIRIWSAAALWATRPMGPAAELLEEPLRYLPQPNIGPCHERENPADLRR